MKKSLVLWVLAGAGALGAGAVSAAVTYGPVQQYYADTNTTCIYVSPASFLAVPAYVHYCCTTDPEIARAITGSVHKNVYLGCSAASWPTTGSNRYGGAVNYIYAN